MRSATQVQELNIMNIQSTSTYNTLSTWSLGSERSGNTISDVGASIPYNLNNIKCGGVSCIQNRKRTQSPTQVVSDNCNLMEIQLQEMQDQTTAVSCACKPNKQLCDATTYDHHIPVRMVMHLQNWPEWWAHDWRAFAQVCTPTTACQH